MKTLFAVLSVVLMSFALPAKAEPATGAVAFYIVSALVVGKYSDKIVSAKPSFNLTDACKAKTVQANGGNYGYVTYEGCK